MNGLYSVCSLEGHRAGHQQWSTFWQVCQTAPWIRAVLNGHWRGSAGNESRPDCRTCHQLRWHPGFSTDQSLPISHDYTSSVQHVNSRALKVQNPGYWRKCDTEITVTQPHGDFTTISINVKKQIEQHVSKRVSSTLVMVMLITCVVRRRLTDEVGFFWLELISILCSLPVLGDDKEGKHSTGIKKVTSVTVNWGCCITVKEARWRLEVLQTNYCFLLTDYKIIYFKK